MNTLAEMKVVITGAASGIGRATARLLAGRGAALVLADLDAAGLRETARDLPSSPAVLTCAGDVRDAAACEALAAEAERHLGRIDALVHCAGLLRPPGGRPRPLHELDEAEFDTVIGVNLTGTFLVNRAILRRMLPRKAGQIVNISSTSGRRGRALDALYSASKAGMIALSESIAGEVRAHGIRVQVILPDAVDTPLWRQNAIMPSAPPGALPPERVAQVIEFCLALPADAVGEPLTLKPLRARRRRSAAEARGAPSSSN